MREAHTIRVLVHHDDERPLFYPLGQDPSRVSSDGRIVVPYGDWAICFERLATARWTFKGFRYSAEPAEPGPIRSVEVTDDHIVLQDFNDNRSGQNVSFPYEILIQPPGGEAFWIDPAIENESGGGQS